jgi:hypothetical protein
MQQEQSAHDVAEFAEGAGQAAFAVVRTKFRSCIDGRTNPAWTDNTTYIMSRQFVAIRSQSTPRQQLPLESMTS